MTRPKLPLSATTAELEQAIALHTLECSPLHADLPDALTFVRRNFGSSRDELLLAAMCRGLVVCE